MTTQVAEQPRPRKGDHSQRIAPRKRDFAFDTKIPKDWFGGDPVPTALVNGVNLLFPAGERFFVRSVRRFADRITDPGLRDQIRGFAGQESKHAHEHERYFDLMEQHGFRFREMLKKHEDFMYGWLEPRLPAVVHLAGTAAAEHFTATMAHAAFTEDVFRYAHPVMRDFLLWHAAEEIEHKAVAFDVLQAVDPRYSVRLAGALLATVSLGAWWFSFTRELLRQQGIGLAEAGRRMDALRKARDEAEAAEGGQPSGRRERGIVRDVFLRGLAEYLRPDFHPWNNDDAYLAEGYLSKVADA